MKKTIALIAGLTLLAANVANASKARLEALGQDMNGSLYIEDNRNILLNPAAVTKFGNFALIEVGTAGDDTPAPDADGDGLPDGTADAQGGFVMEAGGLNYGVFLGHEDAATRRALTAAGVPTPQNTVEFLIGGQAGVAWGASIWYSAVDGLATDADASLSSMGVRLGASTDMWQAFAHVGIGTTGEASVPADIEFEGTSSYNVGGSYNLGTGKIFLRYGAGGADVTAGPADLETSSSGYQVGWANIQEIEENAFFFYSVAYAGTTSDDGTDETTTATLPLTAGFEADANTWLAFRASVVQPIIINTTETDGESASAGGNTRVGAGASLKFDKLRIDGTAFSTGTLNTSDLLGRVALTYNF